MNFTEKITQFHFQTLSNFQVLVAQKNGVIKIFSLSVHQQLMSFDCGQIPLMEADWSVGNNGLLVGAVAGSDWCMFDVSVSR